MKKRPLLLLTNDDGIDAAGLRCAFDTLTGFADVRVVAPEKEQSSCSHAVTLARPVFCRKIRDGWYAIEGTPADAMFIALSDILPAYPHVVISGINFGLNLGIDTFYSGTVAAAREAAFRRIPAVALSMKKTGDLAVAGRVLDAVVHSVLEISGKKGGSVKGDSILLNINIPSGKPRGFQLTRLGRRVYQDHVLKRRSPRNLLYYWINGGPEKVNPGRGSDVSAISKGFVSITPLGLDQSRGEMPGARSREIKREIERRWLQQL